MYTFVNGALFFSGEKPTYTSIPLVLGETPEVPPFQGALDITGALEQRARAGAPALCGFAEYTTPSTPPKKYRKQTSNQDYNICNGSTSNCLWGPHERTHVQVVSATATYNVSTCGVTTTGVRNYGGDVQNSAGCDAYPGALNNTDSSTESDAVSASAPQTGFDITSLTPTSVTMVGNGNCNPPTSGDQWWITVSGYKSWTLSEEDTESDAITRFQAASAFGSYVAPISAVAKYESRVNTFDFQYADAEFRVDLHNLLPNRTYIIRVELVRRVYLTGSYVAYQTLTYEETADSNGDIQIVDDVPNQKGYETFANRVFISLVQS